MDTPKSHARWVRGGLVGASSAAVTIGAHAAAGGGVAGGPALAVAVLLCATVGALVSCAQLPSPGTAFTATAAALGVAQFLGHMALTTTGHHHHSADGLGWSMIAAHAGAALLLGAAITAVEFLYAVCVSVLAWLRLFAMRAPRALPRAVRRVTNPVARRPILITGLGMRAPPTAVTF